MSHSSAYPNTGSGGAASPSSSLDAYPDRRDLIEVRIPGLPAYIGVARAAVDTVSEQLHLSADARSAVKLAVGEACNNAVLYARGHQAPPQDDICAALKGPTVLVSCRVLRDALEIDVTNEGNGFHPEPGHASMPEPRNLSEHGRGLALIELMMDSVQYLTRNGCTTVRMRKQRPPATAEDACPPPDTQSAGERNEPVFDD